MKPSPTRFVFGGVPTYGRDPSYTEPNLDTPDPTKGARPWSDLPEPKATDAGKLPFKNLHSSK